MLRDRTLTLNLHLVVPTWIVVSIIVLSLTQKLPLAVSQDIFVRLNIKS